MALTVLARGTPVPVDRPIHVVVRLDPETVTAERVFPEMRRHMAVSTTLVKEIKDRSGRVTSREFSASGTAYRPWTRGELENQLRYLGVPFDSVVIRTDLVSAPSPRRRGAVESIGRGIASALPGGPGAAAVVDTGEQLGLGEDPAPPTSRLPIILGGVAIVLGLLVAGWAVMRS